MWTPYSSQPSFPSPLPPALQTLHHSDMGFCPSSAMSLTPEMPHLAQDFANNLQHARHDYDGQSFDGNLTKAHRDIGLQQAYGHAMSLKIPFLPSLGSFWPNGNRSNDPRWPTTTGLQHPLQPLPCPESRTTGNDEVNVRLQMPKTQPQCPFADCNGATFGRQVDLRRHFNTVHTMTALWCPAHGCARNLDHGNDPFPNARKDKLRDHIRSVHKSREEKRCWPEWFAALRRTTRRAM